MGVIMINRPRNAQGQFIKNLGPRDTPPLYTKHSGEEWRRMSLLARTVRARVVMLRHARDAYVLAGDYAAAKVCQWDLDLLNNNKCVPTENI